MNVKVSIGGAGSERGLVEWICWSTELEKGSPSRIGLSCLIQATYSTKLLLHLSVMLFFCNILADRILPAGCSNFLFRG